VGNSGGAEMGDADMTAVVLVILYISLGFVYAFTGGSLVIAAILCFIGIAIAALQIANNR
jgi:hypothetical protein